MPAKDDGRLARRRAAAWLESWIEKWEHDHCEKLPDLEVERLLGVGRGTVFRIRKEARVGIDVLLKIRELLNISTDRLLDEWPRGWPKD